MWRHLGSLFTVLFVMLRSRRIIGPYVPVASGAAVLVAGLVVVVRTLGGLV